MSDLPIPRAPRGPNPETGAGRPAELTEPARLHCFVEAADKRAATERAATDGTDLSAVVRNLLHRYGAGKLQLTKAARR